ncbi:tetratricopeptide repeat protein [Actinomadura opuntiae]|uniref:tetratricopeptide repeat protein n=1 Tax=Actinomadura sp. OS1-43 TaxID=604315 RepID=UPI00255B010C|nr:tetratricopeptide repeat protein [Actinomadura sp. OS1-43]MDL4813750.1 tetratricopeptide repeat protein [Actinomadura sp. OS1-43]
MSGSVAGSFVQVGTVRGGFHVHHAASEGWSRPVPAQLLPPRPYFADRTTEMEWLIQVSDAVTGTGEPATVLISGVGGVGKTSLGLAWLNRIREHFPDGQLYTNLRGFSGALPVPPDEPLGHFLQALGVPSDAVPSGLGEQAALFRSITAGRRLIIMLDGAASAAQVRPLFPGHGPALVLVTSRRRLPALALDGASFLPLGPLDEDGAVQLLDGMLGAGRTRAEPTAARSLAALCGRLPLALCTSAARLAIRENWPISRVVAELADERRRLASLGHGDEGEISVRSVFDVTYRDLPAEAARLYRLLSVHPGARFALTDAAAVVAASAEQAAEPLEALVDANLVEEEPDGRYRFHDLARLHARDRAIEEEHEDDRVRAFERLLESRVGIAAAADRMVIPGRWHLGRHYAAAPAASFTGIADALAWLERELPDLADLVSTAHDLGLHRGAWELCEALWGLFTFRKHYAYWIRTHETGAASAAAMGDRRAEARMLEALASAHLNLRDFRAAADLADRALELERGTEHARGEAAALECLGVARLGSDDVAGAIDAFDRARQIQQEIGIERGVAMMTRRLGEALARDGQTTKAIDHLSRALAYFDGQSDDYNRARILLAISAALTADGRPGEARDSLDAALEAATRAGARHEQGNAHLALAGLARHDGDTDTERAHLEQAHAVFEALGAPQAAEALGLLNELGPGDGGAEGSRITPDR